MHIFINILEFIFSIFLIALGMHFLIKDFKKELIKALEEKFLPSLKRELVAALKEEFEKK
jgi:hypothetical protein